MELTEKNQIIENARPSIREVTQISNEELRLLHEIPTFRPLIQTFVVISTYFILAAIGFWLNNWAVWLLVWLAQGFLFVCFFAAIHYCSHNSLYKSKHTNRFVGTFLSLVLLMNFSFHKYIHIGHHREAKLKGKIVGDTSAWQTFPDIKTYLIGLTFFYPVAVWNNWWLVTKDLYLESLKTHTQEESDLPTNFYLSYFKTPEQRQVVLQNNWLLLGWVVLMGGLTVIFPGILFFGYWIPIIFFASPFGFIFSITDHYGCESDLNHNLWNDTRTMISNPIIRFYYCNNNYHVEHHLYPSMPPSNYSKIHELIQPHLQYMEKSYLMFHLKIMQGLIAAKSN
ncbi:MAG: fatty acid desaturase [Nostoc sp.]|uniref:fatty acid desaturase family protein n=1 Tax=Nostoc sp. TaxID=1180 RepID=UPI002FF9135D